MTILRGAVVAAFLRSYECNLGAWKVGYIFDGHSIPGSYDHHLQSSYPTSNQQNQWRSWQEVTSHGHMILYLMTELDSPYYSR